MFNNKYFYYIYFQKSHTSIEFGSIYRLDTHIFVDNFKPIMIGGRLLSITMHVTIIHQFHIEINHDTPHSQYVSGTISECSFQLVISKHLLNLVYFVNFFDNAIENDEDWLFVQSNPRNYTRVDNFSV